MKLIVGLGNPGREYQNTRHNIGFMAIDQLVEYYHLEHFKEKLNGIYYELFLNNEKILLVKPQKYMNLSGEVVKQFIDFYHINQQDVLIIHDDLDMPVGKIKWRLSGSSGGHNGLKNIELHLHSQEYKRLKIGISNNKNIETKDYVLGKFTKPEKDLLNQILNQIPNFIEDYLSLDFNQVMNKYNKK